MKVFDISRTIFSSDDLPKKHTNDWANRHIHYVKTWYLKLRFTTSYLKTTLRQIACLMLQF